MTSEPQNRHTLQDQVQSVSVQFQIHETLIGIFMRTSCLFLLGILLLCAIIQSNTYPTPHQNGNRNDFDRGTIVGARWACSNISEIADLWGISHTGVCGEQKSVSGCTTCQTLRQTAYESRRPHRIANRLGRLLGYQALEPDDMANQLRHVLNCTCYVMTPE